MKDKLILIFLGSLLIVNFLAWNAITTKNSKEIEKISTVIESCIAKS